jgi:MFS family permease
MSKPSRATGGSSRKELLLPVYVPTVLLSLGEGLLLPILPVYALTFDVSFGMAALVIAAAGIGTMLADVPAGLILGRLGLKPTMLIGAALTAFSMFALVFASLFPELIIYRLIGGVGTAMWGLSRHAFITESIAPRQRGQAIAVFGGINRIGMFSGPVVGGLIGQQLGLTSSFYLSGALAVIALVISIIYVKDTRVVVHSSRSVRWGLVRDLLRTNRGDLTAASVAQICGQMVRAGRQAIIPFYGASVLGLNVAQIGTVQSASSVVDMALFIPAGYIMDRYGRKFASVPSFALMGIGMAMIPLTGSFLTLIVVSVLIGIGNGLGSGAMMTLGADLAPKGATGEFLGLWRLVGDSGRASGPVVVGGLTDSTGFTFTAIALGGVGVAAALTLALLVKETRAGPEP